MERLFELNLNLTNVKAFTILKKKITFTDTFIQILVEDLSLSFV